MKINNYLAIMAGGIGSRFWPVSRQKLPKQFLDFLDTGNSLLQSTFIRFKSLVPPENMYVITFEEYADLCREQLPEIPAENIIVEPSRKNTAPTAALASYIIQSSNPNANVILTPADHIITDQHEFERICQLGLDFLDQQEVLLTLGIQPSRPDTGYGYIQYLENEELSPGIFKVKTFTEKPSKEIAKSFIESGDFLWNSGLFLFKSDYFIQEFGRYQSEMGEIFQTQKEALSDPQKRTATINEMYPQLTNISIDYGVIEHSDHVAVIPSDFGWSDLGTWESIYQLSESDYLGNVVYGEDVMVIDAQNCFIKGPDGKLILIQGLEDSIVIDTENVLLICDRDKEQDIKTYLQEVKRTKGNTYS